MNIKEIRASFLSRVRSRTLEEKEACIAKIEVGAFGALVCEKEVYSYLNKHSYSTTKTIKQKFKTTEDTYKDMSNQYIFLSSKASHCEASSSMAFAA
ncbi:MULTISPECIES: hypothetical protein [Vibrio]|uniref:hypothetical protein n=1 Tax=Vibrio TaxID=662 RepID=UPI00148D2609|nr:MULTISPECIES: hypothetical protein [Vibrio]NOI36776.1 hypothetical protein [Vibrio cyclitrophicus]